MELSNAGYPEEEREQEDEGGTPLPAGRQAREFIGTTHKVNRGREVRIGRMCSLNIKSGLSSEPSCDHSPEHHPEYHAEHHPVHHSERF
jgi:hypothetical protein